MRNFDEVFLFNPRSFRFDEKKYWESLTHPNHSFQNVVSGVYIGNESAAGKLSLLDFSLRSNLENKLKILKSSNITHILSLNGGISPYFSEKEFTYKFLNLYQSEDLKKSLEQACQFIEEALNKNEGVLIHCSLGQSRSGFVVVGFLMKNCKISFDHALKFVQSKRMCVKLAPIFEKFLKYEFKM
jgi:protein tyrosine phosphatase